MELHLDALLYIASESLLYKGENLRNLLFQVGKLAIENERISVSELMGLSDRMMVCL